MVSRLSKYQLVAEIAHGGMGRVYLAISVGPARFSKLLVVKELKPELAEDKGFVQMFLEEARLAARLSHPNVVQTYEVNVEGSRLFIVMEYLEGQTLSRILRKLPERFTPMVHLHVISEALRGLEYAHELKDYDGTPLGIVHRDCTPQNIFVTYDGLVKLMDFGIAKATDSSVETRAGVLKGKPTYMAPEQVRGDADPRSDIFAAGVMIWEAVAGRRMREKQSDVEVITALMEGKIPKLADAVPNANPALVRICDRALAYEARDRYPNVRDLLTDLDGYLATQVPVSARLVADIVAGQFEAERRRVRGALEAHLNAIKKSNATSEELGLVDLESIARELSATPSSKQHPPPTAISHPFTLAPPRKRVAIFASAALALTVFGSIWVMTRSTARQAEVGVLPTSVTPAVASEPTPSAAPAIAPIEAAAPPETHTISVKATPARATLRKNGLRVENPVNISCKKGETVQLLAEARGYEPKEQAVACDEDRTLELELQRGALVTKGAAPNPPAHTSPTPPAETASPPATPKNGKRPTRPIDSTNPYEQP